MNIYVYDSGWQGAIVLVAESREQASAKCEGVVSPDAWTVHPLDYVVETMGDY